MRDRVGQEHADRLTHALRALPPSFPRALAPSIPRALAPSLPSFAPSRRSRPPRAPHIQGSDAYRLVARSNAVRFAAGAAEPVQAHVGLTGNPTEMQCV